MKPQLGDLVEDRITKLQGIVVARTEWLNKCVRIIVQPTELHDGKPVDTTCFDEEQLTILKVGAYDDRKEKPTGGPQRGEKTSVYRP